MSRAPLLYTPPPPPYYDPQQTVRFVLKPNRCRQLMGLIGVLILLGVGIAGIILSRITSNKSNGYAEDISIIGDDITALEKELDTLLYSVIIIENTTKKRKKKNVRSGAGAPATLPLPSGITAYHTADCYYQNGDPLNLSHLDDADTSGAVTGNFLGFDGTEWVPVSGTAGVANLNDLLDVFVPAPFMDEILLFDGANWVNSIIGKGSTDPMQIQYRISGSCPAQSWIRSILENGTVVCDNTLGNNVVGSNQIIDGSINDVDIDSTSVQERVTGQCLGDGNYIKYVNQDGSVVCGTTLAPMSVGSNQITDGSIKKIDVDNSEVQTMFSHGMVQTGFLLLHQVLEVERQTLHQIWEVVLMSLSKK